MFRVWNIHWSFSEVLYVQVILLPADFFLVLFQAYYECTSHSLYIILLSTISTSSVSDKQGRPRTQSTCLSIIILVRVCDNRQQWNKCWIKTTSRRKYLEVLWAYSQCRRYHQLPTMTCVSTSGVESWYCTRILYCPYSRYQIQGFYHVLYTSTDQSKDIPNFSKLMATSPGRGDMIGAWPMNYNLVGSRSINWIEPAYICGARNSQNKELLSRALGDKRVLQEYTIIFINNGTRIPTSFMSMYWSTWQSWLRGLQCPHPPLSTVMGINVEKWHILHTRRTMKHETSLIWVQAADVTCWNALTLSDEAHDLPLEDLTLYKNPRRRSFL